MKTLKTHVRFAAFLGYGLCCAVLITLANATALFAVEGPTPHAGASQPNADGYKIWAKALREIIDGGEQLGLH